METTIEIGASGESRATDFLMRRGYRIVARNYRCKLGELDIVARDGTTLVFVEVRSRATSEHGDAAQMVYVAKQRQVTRVAQQYIAYRRPRFEEARFDVVAITGEHIELIKDAWRL